MIGKLMLMLAGAGIWQALLSLTLAPDVLAWFTLGASLGVLWIGWETTRD